MKNAVIVLLITAIVSNLLTSCASMWYRPYKYITIHTTGPSKIIHQQDTISTIDNKAHLKVENKKEPLLLDVATDSLTKTIKIRPQKSMMYWSNIWYNFGIGLLLERKLPESYTYPNKIFINSSNTSNKYFRFGEANKGELYLHLSPSFDVFKMAPEKEDIGFAFIGVGFCLGIDYYHSKKQYIHLGISRNTGGNFLPLFGNYHYYDTDYICLSNNHKMKRFSFGYGISYTNNTWEHISKGWFFSPDVHKKKNYKALGFIFPVNIQLSNNFHLGFVYRPTFYRPKMTDKFKYEQLASINCILKIRTKK